MLYPKEKRELKKLYYACRVCGWEEVAEANLVFTNKVHETKQAYVRPNPLVVSDPALPRTSEFECTECGKEEAVYFQASEEDMSLVFMCTGCTHQWRQEQLPEEKTEEADA